MMFRIEPYTPSRAPEWDAFVRASRNGTFFHTRRFLAYHPEGRFSDASLLFLSGGHVQAVLPAARVEEQGKRILVSHPGASYGGLVLSPECGMADTGRILSLLRAHAAEHGYAGIRFLRLTLPILRRLWSDDQEYWLHREGWNLYRFELSTSYVLSGLTEGTILDTFAHGTRCNVRRAQKSALEVRFSDDFGTFWGLLEAALRDRHGASPTHSLEEIMRLRHNAPNDVRLFAAFLEGKMVAGLVVFEVAPHAAYILYSGQDYAFQELRPSSLLVKELLLHCAREGKSVLDFGISTGDGGRTSNDGLFAFKEGFGGVSVRRESWHLHL